MDDISVKKREIEEKLNQVSLEMEMSLLCVFVIDNIVDIINSSVSQEKLTLSFLKDSLTKSDQITNNMVRHIL